MFLKVILSVLFSTISYFLKKSSVKNSQIFDKYSQLFTAPVSIISQVNSSVFSIFSQITDRTFITKVSHLSFSTVHLICIFHTYSSKSSLWLTSHKVPNSTVCSL